MTLDRVLSRHGLASRTVAAEWIHTGRVRVNSTIERNEGRWIDLKRDRIKVDDRAVSTAKKVYVILNKPANVVTSHGDPQGRKTVYDYLLGLTAWVSPVGRLDKDTSGLLLLTNDTDFGNRLTDPQSKIPKKYWAKVNAVLEEEELVRLRKGIEAWQAPGGERGFGRASVIAQVAGETPTAGARVCGATRSGVG